MADTRTLKIIVTGDSRDGQKAVRTLGDESRKVEEKVGLLNKAFGALGPAVVSGIAGIGVVEGFRRTVGAASDLNEAVSKTQTIFGDSYTSISRWAQNSEQAFGLSRRAALDGVSTFGNFFKQVGLGSVQVEQMSKRFVELSADFASFHNAEPADVMEALSAATRGEYDALQKYVPTVNAAAIETRALADTQKTSAKQLTLAEKATALYNIVLKDGGAAIGDFGRTASGAANQQRILTAKIEDQGAAIGNVLLPAYNQLLSAVNSVGPVYAAGAVAALAFGSKIKQGADVAKTAMSGYITSVRTAANESAASGARFALLRASVSGVGTAAVGAGNALKGMLALVGGPYGIAIAAATLGLGYLISKHQEAKAAEEAHRTTMASLTDAIKANNGAMDENVRRQAAKILNDKKALAQAELLGFSTKDLTEAYLTGGKALQDYIPRIDSYIEGQRQALIANKQQNEEQIKASWVTRENIQAAESLRETLTKQNGTLNALAAENRAVTKAVEGSSEGMDELSRATKGMDEPTKKLTELLYDLTKNTGSSADAANDLKKAWDDLTGAAQSQEDALLDYNDAAIDFRDGLKQQSKDLKEAQDNVKGKTGADRAAALQAVESAKQDLAGAKALDERTKSGIAARKAIKDVAQASIDRMIADIKAGVPAQKALDANNKRIEALKQEAIKAGQSKDAVEKLFKLYGQPPDDVNLALKVTGQSAANAALSDMLVKQRALASGLSLSSAKSAIQKDLDRNRTGKYAGGGAVNGPGTSTSDEAGLYRLSNKEYVIQAESADQKYGHAVMDDINAGRIPAEMLKNWRAAMVLPRMDRTYDAEGLAGGGAVWNRRTKGTWPFKTDASHTKVPSWEDVQKAIYGGIGGGGSFTPGFKNQEAILARAGFHLRFAPSQENSGGHSPTSWHYRGRAIDIGVGTNGQSTVEKVWQFLVGNYARTSKELFWAQKSVNYKNGAAVGPHDKTNHVHWAYDNGGVLPPNSTTTITNATRESEYALTRAQLKEVSGVNIENLNVTVNGNIPSADAQRIAVQIRNELTKVAGRNGGRAGLPSK